MPISLSQLTANRKACVVTFDGVDDVLHLEYYPQRLTARMLADFAAADEKSMKAMAPEQAIKVALSPVKALAEVLHGWDLTAEEGGPVLPIDEETLSGLGITVLWSILGGIMQDGNGSGKAEAPTASRNKRR